VTRFLIHANLPYRFALWHGDNYQHVYDLDDSWSDREIWDYARGNNQVIVSKDADFSDWVLLGDPAPRVVHNRVGNLRIREFHTVMHRVWPQVSMLIDTHRLIIVHEDRLEAVT